ncbi:MAG: Rpn family recombination-promoting nuclease/putative transposase [Lachnospiraceae bacterium]|nr:Rpn family recombination-promoting nuclease/putative transposase [Lachnospiraceae bacterium]
MGESKKSYEMKPLEKMNVIDDFLFNEIMADEENGLEVCRMILICVLKRKIGKIHYTPQKNVPGISEDKHGIRLDAYVTEINESPGGEEEDINVYDIEPDKRVQRKAALPRRSRYYGSLIDSQLLETGIDYESLPNLVTIFILSYDPFGRDAMYYEAGTILKTHPDEPYDDGVRRIYLYAGGELPEGAGEADRNLKRLLIYINESIEGNATDDNTRKLDEIVRRTKAKKDIGVKYMKSWERERELIEAVREEERQNTEREHQRAERERQRAEKAEKRIQELEAMLAAKS